MRYDKCPICNEKIDIDYNCCSFDAKCKNGCIVEHLRTGIIDNYIINILGNEFKLEGMRENDQWKNEIKNIDFRVKQIIEDGKCKKRMEDIYLTYLMKEPTYNTCPICGDKFKFISNHNECIVECINNCINLTINKNKEISYQIKTPEINIFKICKDLNKDETKIFIDEMKDLIKVNSRILLTTRVKNNYINDFTRELDGYVNFPVDNARTYIYYENSPFNKSYEFRYPGATRGCIQIDENNIITDIILYEDIQAQFKLYNDNVTECFGKYIGKKIIFLEDKNV